MMTTTVLFIEYYFWVVTHPKCSHLFQRWNGCPHFSDEIMLVLRGKWLDQGFTGKEAEPANKLELSDVKAPCCLYAPCCHGLTNTTTNDGLLIGYQALCKRKWVHSWESPFKSKISQQMWSICPLELCALLIFHKCALTDIHLDTWLVYKPTPVWVVRIQRELGLGNISPVGLTSMKN